MFRAQSHLHAARKAVGVGLDVAVVVALHGAPAFGESQRKGGITRSSTIRTYKPWSRVSVGKKAPGARLTLELPCWQNDTLISAMSCILFIPVVILAFTCMLALPCTFCLLHVLCSLSFLCVSLSSLLSDSGLTESLCLSRPFVHVPVSLYLLLLWLSD